MSLSIIQWYNITGVYGWYYILWMACKSLKMTCLLWMAYRANYRLVTNKWYVCHWQYIMPASHLYMARTSLIIYCDLFINDTWPVYYWYNFMACKSLRNGMCITDNIYIIYNACKSLMNGLYITDNIFWLVYAGIWLILYYVLWPVIHCYGYYTIELSGH